MKMKTKPLSEHMKNRNKLKQKPLSEHMKNRNKLKVKTKKEKELEALKSASKRANKGMSKLLAGRGKKKGPSGRK